MTVQQLTLGGESVPEHIEEARKFIVNDLLTWKHKISANDLRARFPGWSRWNWMGSLFRQLIKKGVLVRLDETVPSEIPEHHHKRLFYYVAGPYS